MELSSSCPRGVLGALRSWFCAGCGRDRKIMSAAQGSSLRAVLVHRGSDKDLPNVELYPTSVCRGGQTGAGELRAARGGAGSGASGSRDKQPSPQEAPGHLVGVSASSCSRSCTAFPDGFGIRCWGVAGTGLLPAPCSSTVGCAVMGGCADPPSYLLPSQSNLRLLHGLRC